MKLLLTLTCLALLSIPVSAQERTKITVEYDKFEDITKVILWRMPLGKGTLDSLPAPGYFRKTGIELTLVTNYDGKILKEPPLSILFVLGSVQRESMGYPSPPSLILLINETERLKFETTWAVGLLPNEAKSAIQFTVRHAFLKSLSKAKTVEARLGSIEFHFDKDNFDALNEFVTLTTPKN